MNKVKIIFSILVILLGVVLFVYAEIDDSPGGQLIGLIVSMVATIGVIKSIKKSKHKSIKKSS